MAKKRFDENDDSLFDDLNDAAEENPSRFRVVVEFVLDADGHEEAEAKIHELVKEGILAMAIDDEKDIGYSYDITDCTVAEIDL